MKILMGILIAASTWVAIAGSNSDAITKEPVVQLQRTTCYGTCPSYIISLFENGEFIWQGQAHVAHRGVYRGKTDPKVFVRALAALEAAKFRGFKPSYAYGKTDGCKEDWTDNPVVRIYVQTKADDKEIVHNHGCRGFDRETDLIKLQDTLDEILKTKQWIGERR